MESERTNMVNEVIDAHKAIVKSALCQGFDKTDYLVEIHIRFIKNFQSADDPENYIYCTGVMIFPDDEAISKKYKYIRENYHGDLLQRFEELYTLYQNIIQEKENKVRQPRRSVSDIEADKILEDLLTN